MSKKPSFANLAGRLASKPSDAQPAAEPITDDPRAETAPPRPARAKAQPDGRRGILVRARPEAWKALKTIALDGERTLQDVMTEAINDVLAKHGKPPVA